MGQKAVLVCQLSTSTVSSAFVRWYFMLFYILYTNSQNDKSFITSKRNMIRKKVTNFLKHKCVNKDAFIVTQLDFHILTDEFARTFTFVFM